VNTELINELKAKCIVREMRGTNAFDNYMVDRFDTEQFAELIVRECADYVQFYYKDHMCEVIVHDMKQHFGVK
jgi:hypothetical protein